MFEISHLDYMENIIKSSLEKSIFYLEYRNLVAGLLAKGKSTGENQTEDFLNYSRLGHARMKRLDKTFQLSEKSKELVQSLTKKHIWLVLTEGWCGDAAHVLPIMNKIVETAKNIDLKLVLRDENEELMSRFLTNGSRSIPKLVVLDADTKEVLDSWGPRPSEATKMVVQQKEKFSELDANFKKDLQVWYNSNKGKNIEEDMIQLLCTTADCV